LLLAGAKKTGLVIAMSLNLFQHSFT